MSPLPRPHPLPAIAIALASSCALGGCLTATLPTQDAAPPDGGPVDGLPTDAAMPPPRVEGVRVTDVSGAEWPADAAPRRPIVTVLLSSGSAQGEPEPASLLEGEPDEDLTDDLSRAPLRAATEERRVPTRVDRAPGRVILRPLEALRPGARYTVALGAWAGEPDGASLEGPFTAELRVAAEGSGARPTDAWPADGTGGVPPALPLAAIRFDDEVRGVDEGIVLSTDAGEAVPARVEHVACETIGWQGGHCVALAPTTALAPSTGHQIVVGAALRDRTGASVGPWSARFQTAPWTPDAPVGFAEDPCGLDETPAGPGCLLADDRRVALRARASAPVRAWLQGAGLSRHMVAPRGDIRLALEPLAPDTAVEATLRVVDLAGRERSLALTLHTTPPLAPVYITEVRADPEGPEPRQEYVEVVNSGAVPIDLRGFALSDRPDHEGDRIERAYSVPGGARALLVSDGFDPSHPDDDPVPPGVVLVRIGTSLATSGLTNAGEALYLRDPDGHRISAAPATPPPRPGTCVVRVVADGRTGAPGSFDYDAAGGCTPGRADRTP